MDGGKTSDKTMEVIDDHADASLLEHDLGDPDAVRICGLPAPRQVTAVKVIPAQQIAAEN